MEAIAKSSVNIKTSQRKIKKTEEKLKIIEVDIESQKKLFTDLVQKQNSMTQEGMSLTRFINEHEGKLNKFKDARAELKKEFDKIVEREHNFKSEEIEQKNKLKTVESSESEKHALIKVINKKIANLKLHKVDDDPTELESLSEEEIKNLSGASLSSDLEVMKGQLEMMDPDLSSIEDYKKTIKLCEAKQSEVDTMLADKNLQQRRAEFLYNIRYNEFKKGFDIIHVKLKEIYQMLSMEGDAELESSEGSNPLLKGIEMSVRPLKKSWKPMQHLSGGEKTLSSLALVFALHYYRPTPFYVMDEIDAALDYRNIAIVAFYLKEEIKNTQFIIVSLRNPMNELADHLVGITKVNNCTKCLSLNVKKWQKL